jgi:hypothetical protein
MPPPTSSVAVANSTDTSVERLREAGGLATLVRLAGTVMGLPQATQLPDCPANRSATSVRNSQCGHVNVIDIGLTDHTFVI